MALATSKQTCAKCSKGGGIAMCNGCQRSFCIKHFVEHRQELSQKMEDIGQEHDLLRRDIHNETNINSLSKCIDQWEQEAIKTIQTTARKARIDLQQLLNQTKNELQISVDRLTEELRTCRESDDYTEVDIQKWVERLKELRQMIENPSHINIGCENNSTSVIPLIRVSIAQRPSVPSNQERRMNENDYPIFEQFINRESPSEKFIEVYGDILLSTDGLTGYAIASRYDGSCISGIRRYFSNVHPIRLRIEKKNSVHLFFGIITGSEILKGNISNVKSAYGWWDLDSTIVNGKVRDRSQTKTISEDDSVTLILDCDNQQIQLKHHRTNTVVTLPVDIDQCPFPWKIVFRLDILNDCIKILH